MTVVPCKSTRYGEGCGHPTVDHVGEGKTPNADCCCCTWRHNDPTHVETCLDCSITHAKYRLRHDGKPNPTTADVAPYIPQPLVGAFWMRYVGKYFDSELGGGS